MTLPEVENEVILCRGESTACESFDGTSSRSLPATNVAHKSACMAIYDNQALIVAGSETDTVEILSVR